MSSPREDLEFPTPFGRQPTSVKTDPSHNMTSELKIGSISGSTISDPLSTEEHGRLFSAYGDSKFTLTPRVKCNVQELIFVKLDYLLPNDGEEQDRLGGWFVLIR